MTARADGLVPITSAATAFGVSVCTVRRWLRDGAPVAVRGRRGRGGQALLDVRAIAAWRASRDGAGDSTAALEAVAADVPVILAGAAWAAFQLVEHDFLLSGHGRRTLVGALMVGWSAGMTALLARMAVDAPAVTKQISVEPDEISRLARHLRRNP